MIGMTFCGNVVAELSKVLVSAILVEVYKGCDLLETSSHSGNHLVFGSCQSTDSSTFAIYRCLIKSGNRYFGVFDHYKPDLMKRIQVPLP